MLICYRRRLSSFPLSRRFSHIKNLSNVYHIGVSRDDLINASSTIFWCDIAAPKDFTQVPKGIRWDAVVDNSFVSARCIVTNAELLALKLSAAALRSFLQMSHLKKQDIDTWGTWGLRVDMKTLKKTTRWSVRSYGVTANAEASQNSLVPIQLASGLLGAHRTIRGFLKRKSCSLGEKIQEVELVELTAWIKLGSRCCKIQCSSTMFNYNVHSIPYTDYIVFWHGCFVGVKMHHKGSKLWYSSEHPRSFRWYSSIFNPTTYTTAVGLP